MNEVIEVANQTTQNVAPVQSGDGMWGMIIYCVVIMAILYLFMIRPNKKRMAEYQKMLDSVSVYACKLFTRTHTFETVLNFSFFFFCYNPNSTAFVWIFIIIFFIGFFNVLRMGYSLQIR